MMGLVSWKKAWEVWKGTIFGSPPALGTVTPAAVNATTVSASDSITIVKSQNDMTKVMISNTNNGISAGAMLDLAGDGGGGQVGVYSSAFTGVSDWRDTMVIGMDSVLDGGLVLYSSDKVRIQNIPGANALIVTGENVGVGKAPVSKLDVNGGIRTGGATVATLSPSAPVGERDYVTDALAPVWGAAVVGGGAVECPVFKTTAGWVVG